MNEENRKKNLEAEIEECQELNGIRSRSFRVGREGRYCPLIKDYQEPTCPYARNLSVRDVGFMNQKYMKVYECHYENRFDFGKND